MDLYLPADFYHLRDDLPDWSDAPAERTDAQRSENETPARDACVDPLWRVV